MDNRKRAQALLELAIFGSIIIMLLGIILNYGLRYGLQQKAMMSAFRKTLAASNDSNSGGQGSYTLIQDKHIPNPSNPFAVGSVAPFSGSSSVVRTARLHETADTEAELPKTTIQIQDRIFPYKTAGFRDISNSQALDKYKEIYGNNAWETGDGECLAWETNPDTGEEECTEYSKNIKIIDSCEGEIISYDAAVRQCRMIVDEEVCKKECERGKLPGSETDCNAVCSQKMTPPNQVDNRDLGGAWYCANYTEVDPSTHRYTFPILDNIFDFAIAANKPKRIGVQSDYTKQTAMNNTLRKQEQSGIITTTDTINWSDITNRTIVYIDQEHNVQQAPVSTTVGENKTCVNAECN